MNQWSLQNAKARFSELVRAVHSKGPQLVTVHGREQVVVISSDEYRKLTSDQSGAALVEALQACPHPEVDLVPESVVMPVTDLEL